MDRYAAAKLDQLGVIPPEVTLPIVIASRAINALGAAAHPAAGFGVGDAIALLNSRRCVLDDHLLEPAVVGAAVVTTALAAASPIVSAFLHVSAGPAAGFRTAWAGIGAALTAYFFTTAPVLAAEAAAHGDEAGDTAAGAVCAAALVLSAILPGAALVWFVPSVRRVRHRIIKENGVETIANEISAAPMRRNERKSAENSQQQAPQRVDDDLDDAISDEDNAEPDFFEFNEKPTLTTPEGSLTFAFWHVLRVTRWPNRNAATRTWFHVNLTLSGLTMFLGGLRLGERNCGPVNVAQMVLCLSRLLFCVLADPLEGLHRAFLPAGVGVNSLLIVAVLVDSLGFPTESAQAAIFFAALLVSVAHCSFSVLRVREQRRFAQEQRARRAEAEMVLLRRREQAAGVEMLEVTNPLSQQVERVVAPRCTLDRFQVAVADDVDQVEATGNRGRRLPAVFERDVDAETLFKLAAMTPTLRETLFFERDVIRRAAAAGGSPDRIEPLYGPPPPAPPRRVRPVPRPYADDMFDVL